MTQKRLNPAGENGVRCPYEGRHNRNYSTFADDIKNTVRLANLQRRYGLSGSRATLIAALAYDGGRP